jgi:hypothetical protein
MFWHWSCAKFDLEWEFLWMTWWLGRSLEREQELMDIARRARDHVKATVVE